MQRITTSFIILLFHMPALGQTIYCANASDGSHLVTSRPVEENVDYILSRIWLINVSDKNSIKWEQTLDNLVSRRYYENNPMFAECSWRAGGEYKDVGTLNCTNKNGYSISDTEFASWSMYGSFRSMPSANGLPFRITGELTKGVADCSNGVTTNMSLGHIRIPDVKGIITFTFSQFRVNNFEVVRPGPTLNDYKF